MKSRFCIQVLSMTEIPENVAEACKGEKLKSPISENVSVSFDDYYSKSQPERSCAYFDFMAQERMQKK